MLPVEPRPQGYNPLGVKNLDPQWIRRLGQTGKDCYDAILRPRRQGPGRLDERMHGMLGGASCRTPCDIPTITRRSAGPARLLPVQIPRGDVLRLRRRILYVVSEEPVPGGLPCQRPRLRQHEQ